MVNTSIFYPLLSCIGTKIVYERAFLLQMRQSPLARTPPVNLPIIPGVTAPKENGDSKGKSNTPPRRRSSSDNPGSPAKGNQPGKFIIKDLYASVTKCCHFQSRSRRRKSNSRWICKKVCLPRLASHIHILHPSIQNDEKPYQDQKQNSFLYLSSGALPREGMLFYYDLSMSPSCFLYMQRQQ